MRVHPLVYGLSAVAAAAMLASSGAALAQTPQVVDDEQAYIEQLRREDPALGDRYVKLRDARAQALAELKKVEAQYQGAGPGLRGIFVSSLKQARKKYAETSLALLDFFDARDRTNMTRYQEEIVKLTGMIEERKRTRAELEKLLAP